MKAQRLRVTFTRGDEIKYITHLDLMRFWERALRRAEIPVSYSEGFSPHAQLSLAAPLPVGTTSDAELMDVYLDQPMVPRALVEQLVPQLTAGISIASAEEVGLALPALQADMRFAEYDVDLPADVAHEAGARAAVESFLAAETVPWEHKRDDETKSYDIRAQVAEIDIEAAADGALRLRMRLKNDNTGSGRPEQVVAALGLPAPVRIHRRRLILAGMSPSLQARRKHGRYAD
jgi:radical SAM-linked protein